VPVAVRASPGKEKETNNMWYRRPTCGEPRLWCLERGTTTIIHVTPRHRGRASWRGPPPGLHTPGVAAARTLTATIPAPAPSATASTPAAPGVAVTVRTRTEPGEPGAAPPEAGVPGGGGWGRGGAAR